MILISKRKINMNNSEDLPSTGRIKKSKIHHIISKIIKPNSLIKKSQIDFSNKEKRGTAVKEEILLNALNFTDSTVEDIMIPRSDITAIDEEATLLELKDIILKNGHTKNTSI